MSFSNSLAQAGELSRRSIISTFRKPQTWAPGFFFPVLLALVYAGQFESATALDGFPEVDSFLDFLLPASVLQGVAFGATNGAGDLAIDIEFGFFDRLLTSPVNRVVILLGRMAGTAAWSFVQSIFLVVVFVLFGASISGGIGAVLALIATSIMLGLFLGSFSMGLAFRSGSEEVVQSIFPLVFAFLFLSSAFFPTELMKGWYKVMAENNPITFIIDPLRRMILGGFDVSDAAQAILVSGGLAVLMMLFALWQLRIKLVQSR